MNLRIEFAAALILLLLFGCKKPETQQTHPVLINSEYFKTMLDKNQPISIVDVRPKDAYLKGHMPGAVNIWRTDLESRNYPYYGMALDAESMKSVLGKLGIASKQTVVLYDDRGGVEAARVWWLLKQYGHKNISIHSGGLAEWEGDITQDIPEIQPTIYEFSAAAAEPDMKMDFARFEKLRERPGVVVIDARSAAEYNGIELKKGASFSGHVPNAINICYSKSLDFTKGDLITLKSVEELRTIYGPMASPADTVLVYCHSGVRSSYTYFVLTEVLGYKHVYNYDGSWSEWSYMNQAPDSTQLTDKHKL